MGGRASPGFEHLSGRYPEFARKSFQNTAEYFAGTGLAHTPQRVKVLERIIEVIKPLSLEKIDYDVFPVMSVSQAKSPQYELSDIYHHRSEPLLAEVFKKYPRLTTDIPHVYALSACFEMAPREIRKVLMHSKDSEKKYQAQRNLLASYVKNKNLKIEALKQARRAGLKIELYPGNPWFGIRFDLMWYLEDMFCRAVLLGRFDEAHEIAQKAVPAVEIMKTKEPDESNLKAATVHWQFISDNFSQLQKEVLYISGKRRNP